MRVGLLGPLEVADGDRSLEVGGARLQALLMRLALDAGRTVSLGGLVDAVWEQEVPADEVHALQSLVSRLRRALGDAALVAQTPGGYRLALEPVDVDAHRFERLAREGASALRAGEPGRAGQLLGAALARGVARRWPTWRARGRSRPPRPRGSRTCAWQRPSAASRPT